MKLIRQIITLVCVLVASVMNAGETATPIYDSAEQIKAMPPCEATVVHTYPCYSLLRTSDGKKFCIGSPVAHGLTHFLKTLKDGQTYKFPDAFLEDQKEHEK